MRKKRMQEEGESSDEEPEEVVGLKVVLLNTL